MGLQVASAESAPDSGNPPRMLADTDSRKRGVVRL